MNYIRNFYNNHQLLIFNNTLYNHYIDLGIIMSLITIVQRKELLIVKKRHKKRKYISINSEMIFPPELIDLRKKIDIDFKIFFVFNLIQNILSCYVICH